MDRNDSLEKMKELLDNIPGGVGVSYVYPDYSMEMVYLNDGYYELIGAARKDRVKYEGKSVINAIPDNKKADLIELIKKAVNGEGKFVITLPLLGLGEKQLWLQLKAKMVEKSEEKAVFFITYTDVTEYKETYQELERSHAELDMTIKRAGMFFWSYDVCKHKITISDVTTYGYAGAVIENVPEIFKETCDIHPDDKENYMKLYESMEAGVDTCEMDVRFYNFITNMYQWTHIIYTKLSDGYYVGSSMDISEQKRIEEKYKYELSVRKEIMKDSFVLYRLNLTQQTVEDVMCKYPVLKGKKVPFKLTGKDWEEGVYKYISKKDQQMFTRLFSTDALLNAWDKGITSFSSPVYKLSIPGELQWVVTSATITHDTDTQDVIAIIYTKDVTQEYNNKRAIQRVLSSEMEYIAVIDSQTETIRLIASNNNTKNIPWENPVLFNLYKNKLQNKYIAEDDLAEFRKSYNIENMTKEIKEKGMFIRIFSTIENGGNIRRKKVRAIFLDDNMDKIVIGRRDITDIYNEEIRQEQQLKNALEAAKQANQSKTEFYARMSHDMRTPMNGILGLANLSRQETDINILKENMDKISSSGEYLLGLINDTLDFQKIDSGKMKIEPQVIKSKDLIDSIISMVSETAKVKGVEFKKNNVNAKLDVYIRIDPMRTKQIFINLLSNAVKFTPSGGVVESKIEVFKRENNISHAVITITDTGIGMSKEFLESGIFKAFSQERNGITQSLSGTGLGLSIAKMLTELMGGSISVESEKGSGTKFCVELDFPIVEEQSAKKDTNKDNIKKNNIISILKDKYILLAEDHPLNAEIATKLMENAGCKVKWVQDGKACVDEYKKAKQGTYDVILMDIRMPVMTGLEAAKCIRDFECLEKRKEIPIIAMTANAYEDDVKASAVAGMNDHLTKPINPQMVYETIAKLLSDKN